MVLLLKDKNQDQYSTFKYVMDMIFVLHSICITSRKLEPKQGWASAYLSQYLANVCMKANLKRAGINHSVEGIQAWLGTTLVLGTDVTHPGNGALEGTPSIAAVVGSIEANGGRFCGRMHKLPPKQEVRVFCEAERFKNS